MKFYANTTINKPLEMVTRYFADPQYLAEYQDGFINKELLEGTAGEVGAISTMFYKQGKREMELTETITLNDLPNRFEADYSHKHMDNTMVCTFKAIDNNTTLYEAEYEYYRVSFMPKIMMTLFPGMFRKMGQKWMDQFKSFVESQEN